MKTGARTYLTDVLGVEGWVRPMNVLIEAAHILTGILVISPFAMNEDEKAMAIKMLEAAGFSALYFASIGELEARLPQISEQTGLAALVFYGLTEKEAVKIEPKAFEKLQTENIFITELPAISRFLENSDSSKLKPLKMAAWEKIKILKSQCVPQ